MNHSKEKLILALLVGLVAMVATLFLLSTPSIQAAALTVNSTTYSGDGTLHQRLIEARTGDTTAFAPSVSPQGSPATITFTWPLSGKTTPDGPFSSPFGPRLKASEHYRYDFHRGIDISATMSTTVHAVLTGTVQITGTHHMYDSTVIQLYHSNCGGQVKCYSNYLHVLTNTDITLTEGQTVTQTAPIGRTGKSESGFSHLHFEIREGGLYQKHAVNPFKYLPYTDTLSHTVVISGIYIHTISPASHTVTARAVVTSPRNELDFNCITMTVSNGSAQRVIDFQALNEEMTTVENPEILDNPYIKDVCIMPARFNATTPEYRIDFVFYGLQGSDSITLTAEAADVHSNVVSTTMPYTAGDLSISPNYAESWISPGMTGTFTHTLTNTSSNVAPTLTLTRTSAQGEKRWDVRVAPSLVTLGPKTSATITVTVAVSETVPVGTVDCIAVMAISEDGTQAIAVHVITASRIYLPIVMKSYSP